MKKYIIAPLLILISFTCHGQASIGKRLSEIRREESTGTFQINTSGDGYLYIYDNKLVESMFVYFLNKDYVCYATSIKPYSKKAKSYWVDGLNDDKDWKKIKSKVWEMDLGDNVFIECDQVKDNQKQSIFIFFVKSK